MLFASFDFLLFFVPVLAAYWALARRASARWFLLLVCSYFFYAASARPSGGPLPTPWYFAGLLLLSTVVDFACGLLIERARERGASTTARAGTSWLLLSVVTNLGLLGYFKYTGFLLEVAHQLSSLAGVSWARPTLNVLLPIGISFYTFQSLSYTIDVWRGRLNAERSLLRFAMYVAFFPQLVAGPIVRASDFLPQLHQPLVLSADDVSFALYRITKGLLKKVLLGDFIAANFADLVFGAPSDYSSLENLLALYAFTLQIYADFSGYSDIAIGTARLLGFRLPENFDRPYQSATVGEFWRRWHMTLSTWLRDYLFFPLGGSRVSNGRAYFNLWLTMFLVGMWHGASWNFVIYSNLQAGAMLFSRFRQRRAGSALRQFVVSIAVSLLVGALMAGLGFWVLELGEHALPVSGLCVLTSLFLCALPNWEEVPWLRPVHVLFLFHFSVLSRVFFRADTLEGARAMVARLLAWDGYGVRPGLFRIPSLRDWAESFTGLPSAVRLAAQQFSEWGLLVLLVLGLAYHFTPANWLERPGRAAFAKAPAFGVALVMGGVMALLSQLLSGPRANIYFAF